MKNVAEIDSANRSKNIKFNITLSFIYKLIGIGISYLVVPVTINYLDSEQYGIWMTLLSILSWITLFDIGLGNGLRNKLTEALSKDNIQSAKEYISTAYASISTIVIFIFLVLVILIPNLNWNKIFNTNSLSNRLLIELVMIVLCFTLFNFILSLCNQLFFAVQEPALNGLGNLLLNLLSLIIIILLKKVSHGNLIYMGISYGIAMVTSSILLTTYFFVKHRELCPELKLVKIDKVKDILTVGIQFFIIQIALLVIFTTDNIIITQVLGPEHVTAYNISQKLFSVIIMGHTLIVTSLWSAYTEAYSKGDIHWIKTLIGKLNILMVPIIACSIFLAFLSDKILQVWIGNNIVFPKYLISFMAIYTVIAVWNNIYAYFLNGIDVLNLQMYTAIIAMLINIPLSILFSKYLRLGSSGVILGTIVSLSIFAILGPIKTFNIIKNKESKNVS